MPIFYRKVWEEPVRSQFKPAWVFIVTNTQYGTEMIIYQGNFCKSYTLWFDIADIQGVVGFLITGEIAEKGFTPLRLDIEDYRKSPPLVSASGSTKIYLIFQPRKGHFGSSRVEQSFVTTEEVGLNLTVELLATFLTHEPEVGLDSALALEVAERAMELWQESQKE